MNEYVKLGIWVSIIAILFAFLWRKGYLAKLARYVLETREELRKCTWPTWSELKGSTVVVLVAMVLMSTFTVSVDFVLAQLVRLLL